MVRVGGMDVLVNQRGVAMDVRVRFIYHRRGVMLVVLVVNMHVVVDQFDVRMRVAMPFAEQQ